MLVLALTAVAVTSAVAAWTLDRRRCRLRNEQGECGACGVSWAETSSGDPYLIENGGPSNSRHGDIMAIRTVKRELEAKLKGVVGGRYANASGKFERKSYGDSSERLKVHVKGVDQAPNAIALVLIDGSEVAHIQLQKGRGRVDTQSLTPGVIPKCAAGQLVQILVDAEVALEGELVPD